MTFPDISRFSMIVETLSKLLHVQSRYQKQKDKHTHKKQIKYSLDIFMLFGKRVHCGWKRTAPLPLPSHKSDPELSNKAC